MCEHAMIPHASLEHASRVGLDALGDQVDFAKFPSRHQELYREFDRFLKLNGASSALEVGSLA
jgi:hypothetical protein